MFVRSSVHLVKVTNIIFRFIAFESVGIDILNLILYHLQVKLCKEFHFQMAAILKYNIATKYCRFENKLILDPTKLCLVSPFLAACQMTASIMLL
jgi:hypothetical protein